MLNDFPAVCELVTAQRSTSSHTTEKDWILYTDSTAGFGSSSLNKDKGANS